MSRPKRWFTDISLEEIVWLAGIEPIGPATWQKIYHGFSSGREFLNAGLAGWKKLGLSPAQLKGLQDRPDLQPALRKLQSANINLITLDDPDYPALLREISDPPLWLFYRGDLTVTNTQTLTVVGTRKPSSYALEALSIVLPPEIAGQVTIVSGLAYGIDKAAHQLSIKSKGKTIAVLAGGLDQIYPAEHASLAETIIEVGGLLLSEYPPLDRPKPYRFPVRNRVVAGLSPVTVIVEAMIQSGSLTTAKSALDYNREIYAVPGDITRLNASGANFLIQNGAILLNSPAQLADYYHLKSAKPSSNIDSRLGKLLDLLVKEEPTFDELIERSGLTPEELLGLLTQLELEGLVFLSNEGRYQAKQKKK